jgi:hypothetical protein
VDAICVAVAALRGKRLTEVGEEEGRATVLSAYPDEIVGEGLSYAP